MKEVKERQEIEFDKIKKGDYIYLEVFDRDIIKAYIKITRVRVEVDVEFAVLVFKNGKVEYHNDGYLMDDSKMFKCYKMTKEDKTFYESQLALAILGDKKGQN